MKSISRLEGLSIDIVIQVLEYLDQHSQLSVCIVSKPLSKVCIKLMWYTPRCTTLNSLRTLLSTLHAGSAYDYASFIAGLHMSFRHAQNIDLNYKFPAIRIKKIWIENVKSISHDLLNSLLCHETIQTVRLSNCGEHVAGLLFGALERPSRLQEIMIYDCSVTDQMVHHIVKNAPALRQLYYCQSGFISDAVIETIAQQCRLIETLVFTLPLNIVQANTMTQVALETLTKCKFLKVLICKGQIRISKREYKEWLYRNIPSLKHCDLSLDL